MNKDDFKRFEKSFERSKENGEISEEDIRELMPIAVMTKDASESLKSLYNEVRKTNKDLANDVMGTAIANILLNECDSIDEAMTQYKKINKIVTRAISVIDKKINKV